MLERLRKLLGWGGARRVAEDDAVDFRMLAEGSNDVIFRCGADGTAFYVSPSSVRLLGWTQAEILGKGPAAFVVPEDIPMITAALQNHEGGQESNVVTYRVKRKDGTVVWVEASARKVMDAATGIDDLVMVMRDISDRKRQEDRLYELATTDGLTGLANRRAFDEALETE